MNYGASKFWSIFRNSSKNIVEIAFLFRGTVTQKRTGCFEKGGYRANKLLFWIFPLGGVGDTEKNLSYSSFFSGTPSFWYVSLLWESCCPSTLCWSWVQGPLPYHPSLSRSVSGTTLISWWSERITLLVIFECIFSCLFTNLILFWNKKLFW